MLTFQVLAVCLGLFCLGSGQPTNQDKKDQNCLPGWQRFENRCYHFQEDSIQLPAYGELLCHKLMTNPLLEDKTTLAKISNSAQNDFVHSKLNGKCANIGGSDESKEGSWKYSDGQPMNYFNWAEQPWIQPDNGQRHTEGRENCIEMWEDGTWNDLLCNKDSGPRNCMHVCSYDLPVGDGLDAADLEELGKEISALAKRLNVDYKARDGINQKFYYYRGSDMTILQIAAAEGDLELVTQILKFPNVEINAKNGLYVTALHEAAGEGEADVVRKILQHPNVDVNAKNDDDRTPLHFAAGSGNVETIKEILKHPDVNVNAKTGQHVTPLHYAAANGKTEIIKELLSTDQILPSLQDKNGDTPLHDAARWGYEDVVRILLSKGKVDASITNNSGRTALQEAKQECAADDCSDVVAVLEGWN